MLGAGGFNVLSLAVKIFVAGIECFGGVEKFMCSNLGSKLCGDCRLGLNVA